MIQIRRPWTRQPQATVEAARELDTVLTGAGARGIVEGGIGAGVNTLKGAPFSLIGASNFSSVASAAGRALKSSGSGSYLFRTNPITSGPRSLLLVFTPTSTGVTRGLWSTASAANQGQPRVLLQLNNSDLRLYIGGRYAITLSGVVEADKQLSVALSISSIDGLSAYSAILAANGVVGVASGTNSDAATFSDIKEYILGGYSTSAIGSLALFGTANAVWPDVAARSLQPWAYAFCKRPLHIPRSAAGLPTLTALTASNITTSGWRATLTAA